MTALLHFKTGLNRYQIEKADFFITNATLQIFGGLMPHLFVKISMVAKMLNCKKPLTFKGNAR